MRKYHQLTSEERYAIATLKRQGCSMAEMARVLGRHPSTIGRELRRNERSGGAYVAFVAEQMCRARGMGSRRGSTPRRMEPRADLGTTPEERRAPHQPRDHLPLRLARQATGRLALPPPSRSPEEAPQTVRPPRQPGSPGREAPDHGAPARGREPLTYRTPRGRHHARQLRQALRPHARRSKDRLPPAPARSHHTSVAPKRLFSRASVFGTDQLACVLLQPLSL
jgi:hypothetical protein